MKKEFGWKSTYFPSRVFQLQTKKIGCRTTIMLRIESDCLAVAVVDFLPFFNYLNVTILLIYVSPPEQRIILLLKYRQNLKYNNIQKNDSVYDHIQFDILTLRNKYDTIIISAIYSENSNIFATYTYFFISRFLKYVLIFLMIFNNIILNIFYYF